MILHHSHMRRSVENTLGVKIGAKPLNLHTRDPLDTLLDFCNVYQSFPRYTYAPALRPVKTWHDHTLKSHDLISVLPIDLLPHFPKLDYLWPPIIHIMVRCPPGYVVPGNISLLRRQNVHHLFRIHLRRAIRRIGALLIGLLEKVPKRSLKQWFFLAVGGGSFLAPLDP